MSLNMSIDGAACNSQYGAVYGVDNVTRLTGTGFVCTKRVYAGENKRLQLVAPNNVADGVYTKGVGSVVVGPPAEILGASQTVFVDDFEMNFGN